MSRALWQPTHVDPLLILAMDHRGSFGKTVFGVVDDQPTDAQRSAMERAKGLIYQGLQAAQSRLPVGRAGVLVDEQYGQGVIDSITSDNAPSDSAASDSAASDSAASDSAASDSAASSSAASSRPVLAIPLEASGHEWFSLQWGEQWLDHVHTVAPAYAKVLVRDNPDFDADARRRQLEALSGVSGALAQAGVPLLYELLVPATDAQLASVEGNALRYDTELRPELTVAVIADNQHAGVDPALWKIEGLETIEAARAVAVQARDGGRSTDLIVLGRDAPTDRLDHWLSVAAQVPEFVGFAIGRSIWQDPIIAWHTGGVTDGDAIERIARRYLDFADAWAAAAG